MADNNNSNNSVELLRDEIEALRKRMADDLRLLEEKVDALAAALPDDRDRDTDSTDQAAAELASTHIEHAETDETPVMAAAPETVAAFEEEETAQTEESNDPWTDTEAPPGPKPSPLKPSSTYLLKTFLIGRLGPFADFFYQAIDAYEHYRSLGKAPVFFMTITGIVALVLGFGYLLQYAFDQLLGEVAKILLAYLFSAGVIAYGIWMYRRRPEFREYASALLGLGLTLCYVVTYFASSYYGLLGSISELVLVVGITAAGILVSLRFDTRVVAVISLVGGSLSPLLSDLAQYGGPHYFLVQLAIAAAYLYLAHLIRWVPLANLTFAVSVIALESHLVGPSPGQSLIAIISLHGFFYIFSYYLLVARIHRRQLVDRVDLTMSAANLMFLAFALWQAVEKTEVLGVLLAVNAVVAVIAYVTMMRRRWSLDSGALPIMLLSAGLLAGMAILALSGIRTLGFLWQLEGLLLVLAGFYFHHRSVSIEGYSLFSLGLAGSVWQLFSWLAFSFQPTFGFDWFVWLLLGPSLYGLVRVIRYYQCDSGQSDWELIDATTYRVAQEALSGWIAVFLAITCLLLSPEFVLPLMAAPFAILLVRGAKLRSEITNALAVTFIGAFIVQMLLSAIAVESVRFSSQLLVGKIAVVEIACTMYLLQWFYTSYFPDNRIAVASQYLRQLLYLAIPIFFLPKVVRSYPDWLPIALWCSNAIAILLYRSTDSAALRIELVLLAWAAALISLFYAAVGGFAPAFAIPMLLAGIAVFWWVYKLEDGIDDFRNLDTPYWHYMLIAPHYLGACLFLAVMLGTDQLHVALACIAAYYFYFTTRRPVAGPLRPTLKLSYLTVMLVPLAAMLLQIDARAFWVPLTTILALVLLGTILYRRLWHQRVLAGFIVPINVKYWYFHLLTMAVYTVTANQWFHDQFGPVTTLLIVSHATAILFTTVMDRFRHMLRMALIFYLLAVVKIFAFDMAGFTLIEKVIAFVGLGVLLLISAYQFQRFRDRNQTPSDSPDEIAALDTDQGTSEQV